MSLWDSVRRFLAIEPLQERAIDSFVDHPGLTEQLMAVQGLTPRPWRVAGLREALGVPAIFRAVSLIANTTGSLAVEGWRNGELMAADDRPRLIVRPSPFTTPRDFYRDTAYSLATRGEAWWWVAARDSDDVALSLLPVNAAEVAVTEDERDLRYPIIEWRGRKMRNEDMRQITLLREPGALRGIGPLQVCGAAVSVAVEAQEWAANFFASGGYPSLLLQSEVELTEDEAGALKAQWVETPSNMPKVTNPGLTVQEFGANPQGAQMMTARDYQNGDVARMFGIPGSLLDYQTAGSSLTYQNLEGEFTKFVRGCLWPNYLEPIEQAMTDLLTRSTTMKFDVDTLQRADVKTRYEVYNLGVTSGVLAVDEARRAEGLAAGNMENAPMPFSPPQAIPATLPIQMRSGGGEVRCQACNRLLAEFATPPYRFTCGKCKATTAAEGMAERSEIGDLAAAMTASAMAMHELATREQPTPVGNVSAPITLNAPEPPTAPPAEPDLVPSDTYLAALRTAIERGERELPTPIVNVDLKDVAEMMERIETSLTRKPRIVRDERGAIIGVTYE